MPLLVLLLLLLEEGALALRTCFLFGALFALFLLRTGNVGADGVDGGAVFVGKCHFFRLLFKNGKFGRGALRLLAVGSDAGEQRFALVLKALGIFFLRRAGGKKGSALFAEGGDLFVELIALLPEFPALLLAGGGFGGGFRADAVENVFALGGGERFALQSRHFLFELDKERAVFGDVAVGI